MIAAWKQREPDITQRLDAMTRSGAAPTPARSPKPRFGYSATAPPTSAAPSSPSTAEGAVQRTVFLARHAGRELGGTGTVSDDTGCCESTSDR
jgi:hypothetical protein